MDGADNGAATLGQRLHEGHDLEAGRAVQTTVQREAQGGEACEWSLGKGVLGVGQLLYRGWG